MNKTKTRLLALAALAAASVTAAHATPAIWTDWVDPADKKISAGQTFQYTHIITDAGSGSFIPGVDTISSASLTLWLYDDAFFGDIPLIGDAPEAVSFSFDGSAWSGAQAVGGNSWFEQTFSFFSLANLLSDGVINVGLRGNAGDFMFDKSFLTVKGDKGVGGTGGIGGATSVPEPGTLLMFGLGMLGVGFAGRRKQRNAA